MTLPTTPFNLEREVGELNQALEIHKLALTCSLTQRAQLKEQIEQLTKLAEKHQLERDNWARLDKQYNEVITTLAEQLRKMDNDHTMMEKKKKTSRKEKQENQVWLD